MLGLALLLTLAGPSGTAGEQDLFDGAPDPAVKLGATVSHMRVTMRTPPGWSEPYYVGATWLASPDGAADVLVYAVDIKKVAYEAHLKAPLEIGRASWRGRARHIEAS